MFSDPFLVQINSDLLPRFAEFFTHSRFLFCAELLAFGVTQLAQRALISGFPFRHGVLRIFTVRS